MALSTLPSLVLTEMHTRRSVAIIIDLSTLPSLVLTKKILQDIQENESIPFNPS